MNLVKLQDDLKMLPMAVLQSKAQGQDPQVPPWLATSVLNERMDAQKKAGQAQGAQGPQPSIAEQLNQKAGLMALQGQQQQQAQQQMMSQMAQAPQPTPEGVPQPEQQPQPQMMAEGGLARLPVNPRMFDYRAGGIIGFAGEGAVPPSAERWQDMVKRPDESGEDFARRVAMAREASYRKEIAPTEEQRFRARQAASEAESARNMAQVQQVDSMELPPRPAMALSTPRVPGGLPSVLPKPAVPVPPPAATAAPRPRVAPPAQPPVAAPPTGIQTALPQAAPAQSELEKMQMEALRAQPKAQTMDDIRAERKAAAPALLNEPAGLAQLARLKQQQEQYTKSQADRPYERLMSVLGAGGRGGAGSMTSGYLGAVQGERAADAAQAAYQDKIMTAIEAAQRGEATTEQNALLAGMGSSRTAQAEAAGKRLTGIGTARGQELTAQSAREQNISQENIARLGRDTQKEIANIQARATVLASQGRLDSSEGKLVYQAAAKLVDTARQELEDVMKNPMYRSQIPAKEKALADAKAALQIAAGGKMPPSPGAAPAAPAQNRPPLGSFQK